MLYTDRLIRSSTLRHAPSCFSIRADCDCVAVLHLQHWIVQHNNLQSAGNLGCLVSSLHVQVSETCRKRWLDLSRWNRPLYDRYVSSRLSLADIRGKGTYFLLFFYFFFLVFFLLFVKLVFAWAQWNSLLHSLDRQNSFLTNSTTWYALDSGLLSIIYVLWLCFVPCVSNLPISRSSHHVLIMNINSSKKAKKNHWRFPLACCRNWSNVCGSGSL